MLIKHAKKPQGTFSSFAASIFVSRDTLYEWAKLHKEFDRAKRIAKVINEHAMFEMGIKGMNGKIAYGWQTAWIFAMKARHGWTEDGPNEPDEDNELDFEFS